MNSEDKAAYDEARKVAVSALQNATKYAGYNADREAAAALARAAAEVMKACKMGGA